MKDMLSRREAFRALAGTGVLCLAMPDEGQQVSATRKSVRTYPLIEAHRGDSVHAPECTLPAIERAIAVGADRVEVDLRVTRDKHLVILHDDTLDRTTNGRGRVDAHDFEAIRKLDAGSWFGEAFAGTRVPTLREVLDLAKDKVMVDIDLKVAEAVPQMVADIKDAGMLDQVLITGDIPACVEAIRKLEPTITMYSEAGGVTEGIPIARKHQLPGLNFAYTILTPEFIRQAHLHGLAITAWTVNEADRIRELAEWGVDAIMTDAPEMAIRVLSEAGLFRGR